MNSSYHFDNSFGQSNEIPLPSLQAFLASTSSSLNQIVDPSPHQIINPSRQQVAGPLTGQPQRPSMTNFVWRSSYHVAPQSPPSMLNPIQRVISPPRQQIYAWGPVMYHTIKFSMDMTYDDRIFLAIHSTAKLYDILAEHSCKIDFNAGLGVVTVSGNSADHILSVVNWIMANLFYFAEFYFRFESLSNAQQFLTQVDLISDFFKDNFPGALLRKEMDFGTNTVKVDFGCIRHQFEAIQTPVKLLFDKAQELQVSDQKVASTLVYNTNRCDVFFGRNFPEINRIEAQTKTKIECLYNLHPFEMIRIAGQDFDSVFKARFEIMKRFKYCLEYDQIIPDPAAYEQSFKNLVGTAKITLSKTPPTIHNNPTKVVLESNEDAYGHLFSIRNNLLCTNFMSNLPIDHL